LPRRSGAPPARDQIGKLRGIRSEYMRAIVGIRNHAFLPSAKPRSARSAALLKGMMLPAPQVRW
ncbi:hypothetical protein, partial [Bradyrhizobium sp. 138]|uniref:hypothetical protein n=1 Tax=Bradyrhizobium sp. 138 TaxID=2782615 RepID=UPI001FF86E73